MSCPSLLWWDICKQVPGTGQDVTEHQKNDNYTFLNFIFDGVLTWKVRELFWVWLGQHFSYLCLLLMVLPPFPCCHFSCLEHLVPSSCSSLFLLLTADSGSRFLLLFLPSTSKCIFCFLLEWMSRRVDPVGCELLTLLYHKPSVGSQCLLTKCRLSFWGHLDVTFPQLKST